MIEITSDAGTIGAAVEPDPTLRRAVVSITHGWGGLPEDTIYERDGSNTGILISTDRDFDPINAMPRMSAVPVNITPVRGPEGEIRNRSEERRVGKESVSKCRSRGWPYL